MTFTSYVSRASKTRQIVVGVRILHRGRLYQRNNSLHFYLMKFISFLIVVSRRQVVLLLGWRFFSMSIRVSERIVVVWAGFPTFHFFNSMECPSYAINLSCVLNRINSGLQSKMTVSHWTVLIRSRFISELNGLFCVFISRIICRTTVIF
jgi:hypothetical protein